MRIQISKMTRQFLILTLLFLVVTTIQAADILLNGSSLIPSDEIKEGDVLTVSLDIAPHQYHYVVLRLGNDPYIELQARGDYWEQDGGNRDDSTKDFDFTVPNLNRLKLMDVYEGTGTYNDNATGYSTSYLADVDGAFVPGDVQITAAIYGGWNTGSDFMYEGGHEETVIEKTAGVVTSWISADSIRKLVAVVAVDGDWLAISNPLSMAAGLKLQKDEAGTPQIVDSSGAAVSPVETGQIILTPVNITDSGLRSRLEEQMGKSAGDPITITDMAELRGGIWLEGTNPKTSNINGLQHCINIRHLNLRHNQINDLSPLSSLVNSLTELRLYDNQIDDLSGLSDFTNLKKLRIGNNPIDSSDLGDLPTSLTHLNLQDNQIDDLSSLSVLTNLTNLNLWSNDLIDSSDLSDLSTLTNLTWLELAGNQIDDLSNLSSLTNLTWLGLSYNPIDSSDLSDLSTLTKLEGLHVGGNTLTPSDLSAFTNLTELGITSSSLTSSDLSGLSTFTNLRDLNISNNQIDDLSSLSSLTSLHHLHINNNQIDDLSDLSSLTSLYSLHLAHNEINGLSGLSNMTNLDGLNLYDNQVGDISVLVNLTNLNWVNIHQNPLTASAPLVIRELNQRGVSVDHDSSSLPAPDNDIGFNGVSLDETTTIKTGDKLTVSFSTAPTSGQFVGLSFGVNTFYPLPNTPEGDNGEKFFSFTVPAQSNLIGVVNVKAALYDSSSGGTEIANSVIIRQALMAQAVSVNLMKGVNMITVPLKPEAPYTARSLSQHLAGNDYNTEDFYDSVGSNGQRLYTTLVIRYDVEDQLFEAYVWDNDKYDPGFEIVGGQGYIVNVSSGRTVSFHGQAWKGLLNAPQASSATVNTSTWAFVVMGELTAEMVDESESYTLRATNLSSGKQLAEMEQQGHSFRLPMVDLSRQDVVATGDLVKVELIGSNGQHLADSQFTVGQQEIATAYRLVELNYNPVPEFTRLLQNYPNPFNPETWIPFELNQESKVTVSIYDVAGKPIRTISVGLQSAGIYTSKERAVYWDGKTENGETVASGIYFYNLQIGDDYTETRRMVILK